jgi:hypothetical protein
VVYDTKGALIILGLGWAKKTNKLLRVQLFENKKIKCPKRKAERMA